MLLKAFMLCSGFLLSIMAFTMTANAETAYHSQQTRGTEMCGDNPCDDFPGMGESCCPWSDITLKENIRPLENSLERILKLKGVSYTWKENGQKDVGLIAQEVESIYPELVIDRNGKKQIDYQKLVSPLIEAVREQQKQIVALQDEMKKRASSLSE